MKPRLTTALEMSAKMVQAVCLCSMATTHVNVFLGTVERCARLTLTNVLRTPVDMANAEMGSTNTFVTVLLGSLVLTVISILMIVNPGGF